MTIRTTSSLSGSITSIVGICITVVGHLVAHAIDGLAQAERKEDRAVIESLEDRLLYAEDRINGPAVEEVMDRYAEEHQDDGR